MCIVILYCCMPWLVDVVFTFSVLGVPYSFWNLFFPTFFTFSDSVVVAFVYTCHFCLHKNFSYIPSVFRVKFSPLFQFGVGEILKMSRDFIFFRFYPVNSFSLSFSVSEWVAHQFHIFCFYPTKWSIRSRKVVSLSLLGLLFPLCSPTSIVCLGWIGKSGEF